VVGDGVGAGARDFAGVETVESWEGFEDVVLLVVDVEQVELAGTLEPKFLPGFEEAAEDGCTKGVEEEDDNGAGGEGKVDRV